MPPTNHAAQKYSFCSLSRGIANNPEFEAMLGGKIRHVTLSHQIDSTDVMLTWGCKHKKLARSIAIAKKKNIPLWHLEDGFLCFTEPPSQGGKRHSIIVDDVGIYYDESRPSKLENLINKSNSFDKKLVDGAKRTREEILKKRISKYNHQGFSISKDLENKLCTSSNKNILVIDQTKNDASINFGKANEHSFDLMLNAAINKNPDANIFIKSHPDVKLGIKQGHFQPTDYSDKENIEFIYEDCNPHHLLSLVSEVYVVTSQLGFEALLHELPVHTFGMPFYAGWGLTNDQKSNYRRNIRVQSVDHLVAACIDKYCNFYDCSLPDYQNISASTAIELIHSRQFCKPPLK